MKALIISEDENVYTSLNNTLIEAGYDTIIYKWLLKALDNIEEIRPDCIVVSSSEYPRHWKTLVQFVKSGIGGDDVDVYLYEPNPMSKEDEEKARILGITDYFTSLEPSVLEQLFGKKEEVVEVEKTVVQEAEPIVESENEQIVEPAPEPVVEPEPETPSVSQIYETETESEPEVVPTVEEEIKQEEEPDNSIINTGHFMFTHPETHKFIAGKFFDYNGKTMSCALQNPDDLTSLSSGLNIEYFTFFDSKSTKEAGVVVQNLMNISQNNTFAIIEITQIYEEN